MKVLVFICINSKINCDYICDGTEKIVFVLENILEYENWNILSQITFSLLWISYWILEYILF